MNRRSIITLAIITVIVGVLLFFSFRSAHMPMNDPGTIGNTAGNLNNRGLFCEKDGTVYFSNPYDNGALYSMDADESHIKKISDVSVESLNADSRRIYYTLSGSSSGSGLGYIRKATGLFSMKKNGSDTICYTQDPVGIASLCGSNIYYQHYRKNSGTDLDKIQIDKKNNRTVAENMVSPASVDYGCIYYSGASEDMYLYRLDDMTDSSTVIYEHQMYNPVYLGGFIYYMDLETNYQLHRYDMSTGEDRVLTTDRVDMFNVYNNMIYYQKDSSSPDAALMRMTVDGEYVETVATGIYTDINITSTYVYFHAFNEPTPMYHQPVYSGINVSVFEP